MDETWTVEVLADWAVQVGLQPKLHRTGRGLMFSQPGNRHSIFAIYLSPEGDYLIEVAFNQQNEQSWLLRERLAVYFDPVEGHSWPRIGLVTYDRVLLDVVETWADEFIRAPGVPGPTPITFPEPAADPAASATLPQVPAPKSTLSLSRLDFPPTSRRAIRSTPQPRGGTSRLPLRPPSASQSAVKVEDDSRLGRWLGSFFAARGVAQPDGRALYAYKTTNEEFAKIGKQLQMAAHFRGHRLFRKDGNFVALFVLFAAEWWRREYSGGPWAWEPIYQAVGLDGEAIDRLRGSPQALLYPGLERGFRFWRRKVFSTSGTRTFIGSVAAEGGLPLNLLAGEQSGLKRYFRHVLDRYLPLRAAGVPASQIASELGRELPSSFQRDQVYRVVGDIVETTLALRSQHRLSGLDDPVAHLDQVGGDWRSRFPLTLDNEPALALLSDLVVSAARATDSGVPLALTRYLARDAAGHYRLKATVELPTKLDTDALAGLFGQQDWPSTFEIWLRTPFRARLALCQRSRESTYRVRSDGVTWEGEHATAGGAIGLVCYGNAFGPEYELPTVPLEDELPWVFVEKDERRVFIGQGGMRLAAASVLLCTPAEAAVSVGDEPPERQGELAALSRVIYEASGTVQVKCDEDRFTVRTAQQKLDVPQYGLRGQRLYRQANVRQVFIGAPQLFRREMDGLASNLPVTQLRWRPMGGGGSWQPWSAAMCGLVEVRALDGDEVLFRSRAGVLPSDFACEVAPGEDEHSGRMTIKGLAGARLAVDHEGLVVRQALLENGDVVLDLRRSDEGLALFPLTVQWPDMPKGLELLLPMPVVGGRFGAADGRWLADGDFIAIGDLAGVHAVGFNHLGTAPEHFHIDMGMRALDLGSSDQRALGGRVDVPGSGQVAELPLIQLRETFRNLFSLSEELDCRIELTLQGNRDYRRLSIGRYTLELKVEDRRVSLQPLLFRGVVQQADIDALELEVRSLLEPASAFEGLEACASQGVRTGDWLLPASLPPGPWLVIPVSGSGADVRPAIHVEEGYQPSEDGGLRDALAVPEFRARREAIEACLLDMAGDYGHADWRLVFDTLEAFGHLPATALDLWNAFAHVPDALAMLLVRSEKIDFRPVIDRVNELPVSWAWVPLRCWAAALEALRGFINAGVPAHMAEELAAAGIKQRLGYMLEADPVLERTVAILAARLLGYVDEDIEHARLFAAAPNLIDGMLAQASAELRNRQSADAQWPEFPGDLLQRIREAAPPLCADLFTEQAFYMAPVLHAPVALAVRVAMPDRFTDVKLRRADLAALHSMRRFDDDWFREAYGLTLLFLYAMDEVVYVQAPGDDE